MCIRDRNAILDEHEIKAIMMVQGIISRMADNSQRCKNFSLTSCAAVVGLSGGKIFDYGWRYFLIFCVLALFFWYLDTRYLQLERQFRQHHKAIIDGTVNYLDQWDVNLKKYHVGFWNCFFSFSELIYPVFIIIIALISYFNSQVCN